jgi:hypothetical protein
MSRQSKRGAVMARGKKYVYVFDCVNCYGFYGENSLTSEGKLLCPNCYEEQRLDSPYVEKVKVLYEVPVFVSPMEEGE